MDTLWIQAVQAITTAGGVVVAAYGVTTWRRQQRGGAEHETARALLRSGLRLRDALHAARNAFSTTAEEFDALQAEGLSKNEIAELLNDRSSRRGFMAAMLRRLEAARRAGRRFLAALTEAEVLWGPAFAERAGLLARRLVEYQVAVEGYFRMGQFLERYRKDRAEWDALADRLAKHEDDYHATMQGFAGDEFGHSVDLAADELARVARPFLGREWRRARWRVEARDALAKVARALQRRLTPPARRSLPRRSNEPTRRPPGHAE